MATEIPEPKYTAILTIHGSRDAYPKIKSNGYSDGVEPEVSGEVSKVVIRAGSLSGLYAKLQRHIEILDETSVEDEI